MALLSSWTAVLAQARWVTQSPSDKLFGFSVGRRMQVCPGKGQRFFPDTSPCIAHGGRAFPFAWIRVAGLQRGDFTSFVGLVQSTHLGYLGEVLNCTLVACTSPSSAAVKLHPSSPRAGEGGVSVCCVSKALLPARNNPLLREPGSVPMSCCCVWTV